MERDKIIKKHIFPKNTDNFLLSCDFHLQNFQEKDYDKYLREALTIKDFDEESFGNVPVDILGPYCAMDCETTYRLAKKLVPELKGKLKKLFYNFYSNQMNTILL